MVGALVLQLEQCVLKRVTLEIPKNGCGSSNDIELLSIESLCKLHVVQALDWLVSTIWIVLDCIASIPGRIS